MSLSREQTVSLMDRGFSRRRFGRISSLLAAGAALPFYNEFTMAQEAENRTARRMGAGGMRRAMDPDAVRITSNENPLGPCKEGLEAIYKVAPLGGRYSPTGEAADFVAMIAETEGVKQDYVLPTGGSSPVLHASTCAFTSPTRVGPWPIRATAGARRNLSAPKWSACRCGAIIRMTSKP